MPENLPIAPPEPTLEESEIEDETEELPSLEDSGLDDLPSDTPTVTEPEVLPPAGDDFSWDESVPEHEPLTVGEEPSVDEAALTAAESGGPPLLPLGEPEVPTEEEPSVDEATLTAAE